MTHRYTRWDGRQRVQLDAERVFEKLRDHLSYTDDISQAIDWLIRQGVEASGLRVVGLDEILEQLRAEMRQRYRRFNLRPALDEMRRKLDRLLDVERETLNERRAKRPELDAKRNFLERLPRSLSGAIERLRGYDFEDAVAAEEFGHLLEDLENIRRLEEFERRYGELFDGPQSLDYERALEVVREIEALRMIERELVAGRIETVGLDELRDLVGVAAVQDLEDLRRMLLLLDESGYLTRSAGRTVLSPKGVRRVGQLALRDIYQGLLRDRPGTHEDTWSGTATMRPEATKTYHHGDPLNLDLVATLKSSLARRARTPLELEPRDFRVYESEDATSAATVLLLDMSWSMSWEGRFAAAKKVAMAMESLIRSRYPRDYFAIVGFFTRAVQLKPQDLPEASWNMGDPFTNLQDGLRLAASLLARHPSANRQLVVITDGQPTAYFSRGRLYCEWPLSFGGISMRAAEETLKEAERVTRMGVTINTIMLDDSPSLQAFVDRMTRVNRGRAFYTRPERLGEYLLVDYISRKRKKV